MYVQLRYYGSEIQTLYINCRSINETMDELRNDVSRKLNISDSSALRLFCDGKELENGHSLYDYNIKVNDVIQVTLRTTLTDVSDTENNEKTVDVDEDLIENFVDEDDYYKVGDFVDAWHSETGGWFEARVIRISINESSTATTYYVSFEKSSLGDNAAVNQFQLRPQSAVKLAVESVNEGDIVLANFKSGSAAERGYWYDCKIEKKSESRKTLYATVFMGDATLKRQRLGFDNEMYKIETIVRRNLRSKDDEVLLQFGAQCRRATPADCDQCGDDGVIRCRKCSCNECGGKNAADKQIICDECDAIYHIWCLDEPLDRVPDDDWYCDLCRNSDRTRIADLERTRLGRRMKSLNRVGVREWGRGMACMGRTQICELKDHFGPIPGVEVGMWWRFRFQASEAGVHTPLVAGIHGKESRGAYSIVFSCSYDEDIDLGDQFYYTASGGKDLTGKSRVGGRQTKNQELKRCNKALAVNCYAPLDEQRGANARLEWQKGKPVRVLRSGNARGAAKKSPYLPKVGVRYDGIYKVVKYWPQIGDSGFLVWRYLLRRDDETPAPWTKQGKRRAVKLGLTLIHPPGWNQQTASKRSWRMDENAMSGKKVKVSEFAIAKDVLQLIGNDTINTKTWQTVLSHAKSGKLEFYRKLEDTFRCVCCLEIVKNPVTTSCSHNICKVCLSRSFESGVNTCPICRTVLGETNRNFDVNNILKEILSKLILHYQ